MVAAVFCWRRYGDPWSVGLLTMRWTDQSCLDCARSVQEISGVFLRATPGSRLSVSFFVRRHDTHFMNPRFITRTFAIITSITLLAIIGSIWFLVSAKTRSKDRILRAKFDQLQGYQGDPIIQIFRDSGPDAVAFLARQMESKDSTIRVKAVGALRQMGTSFTASDIGLAALCAALNQSDIELRSRAEGALGDLGPKAKAAVPALIKCVSGGTDINGVWALGRIGPDAKAALPVLESKMSQETGRERVYAAGAVWKIGGENVEARMVVKKALEDPDPHVRVDAKNVLVESPEMSAK